MASVPPAAEGGFVRVPRSYIHLPVSPGAKAVLLHLCAAANDDGESWYSYADIADLIGRSKASVTAYVRELVDIGLIESIRQTMANGYNYRRRLKINGWRDLLAHWATLTRRKKQRDIAACPADDTSCQSSPAASKTMKSCAPKAEGKAGTKPADLSGQTPERSVQPADRQDPTGPNNIHQTKTHRDVPPRVVWSDHDERAWRSFRPSDRDPPSVAQGQLDDSVAMKLEAYTEDLQRRASLMCAEVARKSARHRLAAFADRYCPDSDAQALEKAADAMAEIADTAAAQEAVMDTLAGSWKPHWRRMSSPEQIRAMVDVTRSVPGGTEPELRRELGRFRNRAWVLRMHQRERVPA